MKQYLVDVPVRVNIWIRPECQRKQFEVIKRARPSILFLQSDGGRNEEEWEAIKKNREIFDTEIDWDCKVHKLYEEKNLGLYTMGKKVSEYIWKNVDRCIFLEDDHIPAISFFKYCAELLDKYKDDTRISTICGMNHLGRSDNVTSDYFFSAEGSIWGTATWKRVIEQRDIDLKYARDSYIMESLRYNCKDNDLMWKNIRGYADNAKYNGHIAAGEFYNSFAVYGQHQLMIIPKINQISNIGAVSNAAHASEFRLLPRGVRKVFNIPTAVLQFPLKHPDYVIPDICYAKKVKRIMGNGYPLVNAFRRIERIFLAAIRGELFAAMKKRAKRNKQEL